MLVENIGETFEAIGIGKDFLNRTSIVQKTISRINKWDIKLKSCTAEETINRVKRQPTEWRKSLIATLRGED